MKKIILNYITCIVFSVITVSVFSQERMTNKFRSEKLTEYKAIKNPEISFDDYIKLKISEQQQADFLLKNPSKRFGATPLAMNSPCGNGDFESGLDPNEWSGAGGLGVNNNGSIDYTSMTSGLAGGAIGLDGSYQTIVSAGIDPNVGISTVAPGGSTNAIRIGNMHNGRGAELLSKSFIVSPANAFISFWYAVVLQNAGHDPFAQPSFRVRILDCNTGQEIHNLVNLGGGADSIYDNPSDPFQLSTPNNQVQYKDWECAQINLSAYIGSCVTIQFVTKDCSVGGHYGYAYIDNFCGMCSPLSNTGGIAYDDYATTGCGNGNICFKYNLPKSGNNIGTTIIHLNIYQNGSLLTTINSPTLSNDSNYCFPISISTIPGINKNLTGIDFTATADFTIGAYSLASQSVGIPVTGMDAIQNNDYDINCKQCCPGPNLITNGNFDTAGPTNTSSNGFQSSYLYETMVSDKSIVPGRYGLLNSAQALIISPTWNTNCAKYKKHLIINGYTDKTTKIAWQQLITVKRGSTYKFCADFKNLDQCGFNVMPIVTVKFLGLSPTLNLNNITISLGPGCNWQTLDQTFTVPGTAGTANIILRIELDEKGKGDGNDVAIDNINLVEMPKVEIAQLLFDVAFSHISNGTFNITATPVSALNGCTSKWTVEELNKSYVTMLPTAANYPFSWENLSPNTFINYVGSSTLASSGNPGVFELTKRYRITYEKTCPCTVKNKYAVIVDPYVNRGGQPVIRYYEDKDYMQQFNNSITENTVKTNILIEDKIEIPLNVNEIKVYPNPTKSAIYISASNLENNSIAKLFDVFGQLIKTMPIKAKQKITQIDLTPFPSGTYMIQIVLPDGKLVFNDKVVKH